MTSVTRRTLPPFLVVLALAGCSAEVRGSARPLPSEAPSEAPTTAPTTAPTSAKPVAAKPVVSVAASANVKVRYETKATLFRSPTGNIGCEISRQQAYCDILDKDWTAPPPAPGTCEWDWGLGTHVGTSGKGAFNCASDTVAIQSSAPLAYGAAVQVGTLRCTSRRAGMHCVNTATGHGFTLAKASYKLF